MKKGKRTDTDRLRQLIGMIEDRDVGCDFEEEMFFVSGRKRKRPLSRLQAFRIVLDQQNY